MPADMQVKGGVYIGIPALPSAAEMIEENAYETIVKK